MPEYDARKFPRQFVHFVEIPYRRRPFLHDEAITEESAPLLASECQGCEDPPCVGDCPARIDIPNVLRRVEARNFVGAEREARGGSLPEGSCGRDCPAGQACEGHCYRRSYAGQPVPIGDLLEWVGQYA
jgi:NADPH-dependent glutamate synthase beta subunit-like oxidoreductase